MRKLIYTIGAAACISLAACTGSSEYDAYVKSLKAQTAAVDTISSAQSYAAFLENSPEKISNSMKNRQRKSPA